MEIAVAMSAWKRPKYLERVVDSLIRNPRFKECGFYATIDASEKEMEVVRLLQKAKRYAKVGAFRRNGKRLGVLLNNFAAVNMAFEKSDAEVVLFMQDDSWISPDAIDLVKWFHDLPSRHEFVALWLCNYKSEWQRPFDIVPSRGDGAIEMRKDGCRFHGEMWAMTRMMWEEVWKPNWSIHKDAPHPSYTGTFSLLMHANPEWRALLPMWSRGIHIGKYGGGCSPSFHDRLYGDIVCSGESHTKDEFKLCGQVDGV